MRETGRLPLKFSKTSLTALGILTHLRNHRTARLTSPEIGKALKVSTVPLAKILQKLVRAGLIRSYRGVKGGYLLAHVPEEIPLLSVLEAIEGKAVEERCLLQTAPCTAQSCCSVYDSMRESLANLSATMSRITLAEIATLPGCGHVPEKAQTRPGRRGARTRG